MVTALHRCPECSKTFPSDKALHGHMRLHPGRPYRGVNPHSNATKSCKAAPTKCSTSGSDSGEGRGSDAGKSSETSTPDNCPGQYKQILNFRAELEAFYKDWDTEKYYEGDGSQYEARYIRTLDLELYDPRFRRFCKRWLPEALEEDEKEEEGGIKTTNTPTMAMSNGMSNGAASKANIATKKRKVNEIEANTSNDGQHMCVTCEKTFNSHQALGGHQTKHRQKTPASSPPATKEAVEAKVYKCKICKQEFPSGQALGGHQRLHYQGRLNHNSAVKGEVEKSGPGSSPACTHGSLGLAANGDDYEYEEGEILPSPDDSAAVQLELEMQVEVEDEGSKGRNLAALQSKSEMVEVEDEGSKGRNLAALQSKSEMQVVEDVVRFKRQRFNLNENIINKAEKVAEEGKEKGAMVTNKTHVDPRSNHAQRDKIFHLPSTQPQLPRMQQLL